jgi:hypothetical protein
MKICNITLTLSLTLVFIVLFFHYVNYDSESDLMKKQTEYFSNNNKGLLNSNPEPSIYEVVTHHKKEDNKKDHVLKTKPDNYKLAKNTETYFGHQIPLEPVSDSPLNNEPMAIFSKNICSPLCCPSTYSCSNGCVCTTDQQRDMIKQRGGNRKPKCN